MRSNSGKQRADQALVEQGLCESRTTAQRLIMAGQVRIGADHIINKPSQLIVKDADLRVQESCPYVSRGAYKLLAALDLFRPEINGAIVLDIGASTGGFTDLMLQNGAARVYAVDSGTGQLHYRLRQNPKVVTLERTNARYLTEDQIPEAVAILVADVSFISLRKVLPAAAAFLVPTAWAFTLIKPQFEAQRNEISRGGIVRSEQVQRRCVHEITEFAQSELHWILQGVVPSPIKGPAGNQEYIAAFRTAAAQNIVA